MFGCVLCRMSLVCYLIFYCLVICYDSVCAMHNIPSPDFLRGIQANLKSMLPEGLIVEDRCLTNIV